jgi:hypothetical protein
VGTDALGEPRGHHHRHDRTDQWPMPEVPTGTAAVVEDEGERWLVVSQNFT